MIRTRKKSVKRRPQASPRRRKPLRKSHWSRRGTWMPSGKDFRAGIDPTEPIRVKVGRDLQWVLPYLEKTHEILPRLQLPLAINAYRPSLRRRLRTLGSSYYDEGVINLVTHMQIYEMRGGRRRVKGLRRLSRYKILETLAHELAHLHVAEHNFEHAEMTKTIFRTFGLKRACPHCGGSGRMELDCNPY